MSNDDDSTEIQKFIDHLKTIIQQTKEIEDLDPEAYDEYQSYKLKILEFLSESIQRTETPNKNRYETISYLTIEAKWTGDLKEIQRKTPKKYNPKNNNYDMKEIAYQERMDKSRAIRNHIRETFQRYGDIVDDDRLANQYGINLPTQRMFISEQSPNRILTVTYVFRGNPKIQEAKIKQVHKLINQRRLTSRFQNTETGKMIELVFYDIQEHIPMQVKAKPIFNRPTNNSTSNQNILKNDFVIFNVSKEFTRKDIITVITEISKIDVSKIYRPPCCDCIQFPNNTWFINTFIQLKRSDLDKIEAVLGGTLLPRPIYRKNITDAEISEELSTFNKGNNQKIEEQYYENRPVFCEDYQQDREDYHNHYDHYD